MHLARARPTFGSHVFEATVAEVAINQTRAAMRVLFENLLDLRVDVAGDGENVGPAVIVEVNYPGPPLNVARMVEARRARGVFKEAATHVLIKRRQVVGKMRLEDVGEAVAVIIADRHAHGRLR